MPLFWLRQRIAMAKVAIPGSLHFPTKNAAKTFFRGMRDRYRDGQRIAEEDDQHLRHLVAIHPEAEAKVGSGISHFTVETERRFGTTRHFVIHRIDGSSTDVSFLSAIDGTNDRGDRLEALRRAIEDHVVSFRDSTFASKEEIRCPFRGTLVTRSSYHVDHKGPRTFIRLVEEWLEEERLRLEEVLITPPADNQIVRDMTDKRQLDSWRRFHHTNATLQLVSPLGNLSDARM